MRCRCIWGEDLEGRQSYDIREQYRGKNLSPPATTIEPTIAPY